MVGVLEGLFPVSLASDTSQARCAAGLSRSNQFEAVEGNVIRYTTNEIKMRLICSAGFVRCLRPMFIRVAVTRVTQLWSGCCSRR